MMVEKQLHKCLVGYFSHLSSLDDRLKELRKCAEKPLTSLKNHAEQLRLVSSDRVDKADFPNIDELRARLLFKINVGIEDEIGLLIDIISRLNQSIQELKNKLTKLNSARNKVDPNTMEMEEFVSGTPHRPRLDLLMEWAVDSHTYYREFYSAIYSCLKNLDCKDEKTVTALMDTFAENKQKRIVIERILAFTQFLAKENHQ